MLAKAKGHARNKTTCQGLRVYLVETDPVLLTRVVHLECQVLRTFVRAQTQAKAAWPLPTSWICTAVASACCFSSSCKRSGSYFWAWCNSKKGGWCWGWCFSVPVSALPVAVGSRTEKLIAIASFGSGKTYHKILFNFFETNAPNTGTRCSKLSNLNPLEIWF